ncbi:hypothetical protein SGRIM128S_01463 [Streptomyces griseomycini]
MAVPPEGTPCWADATFSDVEGAERFYSDVLGWTFSEASTEFGDYTEAYAGGKAVAALVPPMPGQEGPSQWCLYFAVEDAAATAVRIRDGGGELLMEPMGIGDFGTMCLARDPGGVVFGLWQAGTHEGFGATAVPGAYCWAEILTREPEKSDAFFPAVFPYRSKRLEGETDFRVYDLGERSVLGRMRMTEGQERGALQLVHRGAGCGARGGDRLVVADDADPAAVGVAHHVQFHAVDEHGVPGPVVVTTGGDRPALYPAAPVDLVEAGGGVVAVPGALGGPRGRDEGRLDPRGGGEGGRRGERAATAEFRHVDLLGVGSGSGPRMPIARAGGGGNAPGAVGRDPGDLRHAVQT